MAMSRKSMVFCNMFIFKYILTLYVFVFIGKSDGKDCKLETPCKCNFDDGSGTVDLSGIGKQNGSALIMDEFAADNYVYSFNPCYPFTEGTCVNAAACQFDSYNNVYFNIGDANKVAFSYDGTNVVGTYTSDDMARTSIVTYTCDPTADDPTYTVDGETSTAIYGFNITSKDVCPTGGLTTDPPAHTTDGAAGTSAHTAGGETSTISSHVTVPTCTCANGGSSGSISVGTILIIATTFLLGRI